MKRILPFCMLMLMGIVVLGQQTVSGTVSDAQSGEPIPGATVLIKGTDSGTTTDLDGKFRIQIENETDVLVFSSIGFASVEQVVGSRAIITVAMDADITQLGEVVVTALGIERDSKTLGYSVSRVKGEQFTKAREISVADNLVGRVAGLNSSAPSTGPGGSSRVTIRGNSSLSFNNQPLYVINGIQMNNDNLGSVGKWDGADFGDGISSINPDDIEDITVLKGGAAAALYGQRGRNGVILITTKSGKSSQGLGVEFNSNVAISRINDFRDFQEKYGQGTLGAAPTDQTSALNTGLTSWGAPLDGSMVTLFDGRQHPYSAVSGGNLNDFYETGATYTNSLAISGGGESGSVRLSLGDLRNTSVYPGADYKRQTINLDASYKLSPQLTGSANVNYTKDGAGRTKVNDAPGNGNYAIMFLPPNVDAEYLAPGYDELKNEIRFGSDAFTTNPYFAANRFITETSKDRVLSVASLRYAPLEWLYVQARIANDFYAFNATQITPTGTAYRPTGGLDLQRTVNYNETNADFLVGINKDVNRDFSIGVTLGGNLLKMQQKTVEVNASGFAFPFLYNPGTATTKGANVTEPQKEVHSLYGSVELGFRDMLFLNITDRNDWSSTLPSGNNSYNYPSVNLSYVFSESLNMPWMNMGKIRAGYARVGGDAPVFATNLYYGTLGNAINGVPLGNVDNNVPNPQIEPLQVTELEIGGEMEFLQKRLFVDLAWYKKQTLNDIVNVGISRGSGYQTAVVNIAEIENTGVEFLLGGVPVKTQALTWTSTFNISNNKNTVIGLAEGQDKLTVGESRNGRAFIEHVVGKPFAQVMAYDYMRDDAGNLILGATGLPQAASELTSQGTGVHPVTGGWSNDVRFKNLTLSFLIDFKYGGVIYSGTNAIAYGNGLHKATLEGRGDGITVSGVDADGNTVSSTVTDQNYYGALAGISKLQVYDADFIKFRSLSLTYNFPNLGNIKGLSISLVGRNLFYIKKSTPNIDPESNYTNGNAQGIEYLGLPTSKTYGINLGIKF
ncbi:MAG: SusC/RagA family TonB-linked outer membrane protein [Marinoscillum sp.]|uniref:SusC/RagA family TonB-linked outer membrane protein n=1 Tax=Marinoscillum sp. TaxID=2024838 RepID=UPI0033004008